MKLDASSTSNGNIQRYYDCGNPLVLVDWSEGRRGESSCKKRTCPLCGPLLEYLDYLKILTTIPHRAGGVVFLIERTTGRLLKKERWEKPYWCSIGNLTISTRKPLKSGKVRVVNLQKFLDEELEKLFKDPWDKAHGRHVILSREAFNWWYFELKYHRNQIEQWLTEQELTEQQIAKFFYLASRIFDPTYRTLFLLHNRTEATLPEHWAEMGILPKADWIKRQRQKDAAMQLCVGGERLLDQAEAMEKRIKTDAPVSEVLEVSPNYKPLALEVQHGN